ncbi:hypothetical protein [Kutzneria sp. NPDC051319]|uniref:hypothetical protein n=1 Tax=Kutzneria sp. NPDC051319 TaxID=3155047 RepID=UPI00344572B5
MPSAALQNWNGPRQGRINQLLGAHKAVGGGGRGRRWTTEQINWSLTIRIAGEFQGFCRDLHDDAVECFVRNVAGSNQGLATVLQSRLTDNRKLDTGNAHPGSLGNDFARFGITLWSALEVADSRASRWNRSLTLMNRARNAIAHADEGTLSALKVEGCKLQQLATVKRWIADVNGLATLMDKVLADYLAILLGCSRPW